MSSVGADEAITNLDKAITKLDKAIAKLTDEITDEITREIEAAIKMVETEIIKTGKIRFEMNEKGEDVSVITTKIEEAKSKVAEADAKGRAATNGPGATDTSYEHYITNGVCVCFPEYDKTTMSKEALNSATILIKDNVKNKKNEPVKQGSFKVIKNNNNEWELADGPEPNSQNVYDSFIGKDTSSEQMAGGSGKYIRQTKSKKSKRRKGGRSKRRPLR